MTKREIDKKEKGWLSPSVGVIRPPWPVVPRFSSRRSRIRGEAARALRPGPFPSRVCYPSGASKNGQVQPEESCYFMFNDALMSVLVHKFLYTDTRAQHNYSLLYILLNLYTRNVYIYLSV